LENIRFSVAEIKKFSGLDVLSDEQASCLVDFLAMYAIIAYNGVNEYGKN